jgi:hypothetical protein
VGLEQALNASPERRLFADLIEKVCPLLAVVQVECFFEDLSFVHGRNSVEQQFPLPHASFGRQSRQNNARLSIFPPSPRYHSIAIDRISVQPASRRR